MLKGDPFRAASASAVRPGVEGSCTLWMLFWGWWSQSPFCSFCVGSDDKIEYNRQSQLPKTKCSNITFGLNSCCEFEMI